MADRCALYRHFDADDTPRDYDNDADLQTVANREQEFSDALRAHFGNDVPAILAGYVLPVPVDPIAVAMGRIWPGGRKTGEDYPACHARQFREELERLGFSVELRPTVSA